MIIMLRDDQVIELFDSHERPPSWIEGIDIENGEYQFCDDRGQPYVGVIIQPSGIFRQAEFRLQPQGTPDIKQALALIDQAKELQPNDRFSDLNALRNYLTSRSS
jgi:hypothetical protein